MNMPKFTAPASIAAPMAKRSAPIAIALVRPILSDTPPANIEDNVVVKSTDETTKPCIEDESVPKVVLKLAMAVTGPIVPVSRLVSYVKFWSR
jgi:hypothetical protein